MMYMEDAVNGIIEFMQVDSSKVKVRTSYNVAALAFAVKDLA